METEQVTLSQKLAKMATVYRHLTPLTATYSLQAHDLVTIQGQSINRQSHAVQAMTWLPGGEGHLVAACKDQAIRIYDVAALNKNKPTEFKAHSGTIYGVDNDGSDKFATVSADKSVKVWDHRTPKTPSFKDHAKEELLNCRFNHEGTVLAVANTSEEITFYDLRKWQERGSRQYKHKSEINCMRWLRNDGVFMIGDYHGHVSLCEGDVLTQAQVQPVHVLEKAHATRCECMAVSPDGLSFVTGGQDSLLSFWDTEELLCSGSLSFNDYQVRRLEYNSTGEYLASICYDEIQKKWQLELYAPDSRQLLVSPTVAECAKNAVMWHPSNPSVVAWAGDSERGDGSMQTGGNGVIQLIKINKA